MPVILADVLSVTLIILGLLVTLPAFWLLLRALFPAAAGRSRDRIERHPLRCLAAGIPVAAVALVLPLLLLQRGGPLSKSAGFLLFLGGFTLAGLGLAGMAAVVGERLASPADGGRPWRAQVRGAACLVLSFLLPFIGWFGILPLAAVAGVGAASLALAFPGGAPAEATEGA